LHDVFVDQTDSAARYRAHCELLMARKAELADEKDVERRAQGGGDLGADGNAAAGKRQHDHVAATSVPCEIPGEHAPGIGAIVKDGLNVRFDSHTATFVRRNTDAAARYPVPIAP